MPVETAPTAKTEPLFRLGQTCATPGALGAFEEVFGDRARPMLNEYLNRHQCGDWGPIDPDDRGLNELALEQGERIFSVYHLPDETRIWIITEWDRSYTTVLLPGEY